MSPFAPFRRQVLPGLLSETRPPDGDTGPRGLLSPDDGRVATSSDRLQPPAMGSSSAENFAAALPSQAYPSDDKELLRRMMFGEATANDRDEMTAIGWTAINRMRSGRPEFPRNLRDVLLQPPRKGMTTHQYNAFDKSRWKLPDDPKPLSSGDATAYRMAGEIAEGILSGAIPDPTGGAMWFHHDEPNRWFQGAMAAGGIVPTRPVGTASFYRAPLPAAPSQRSR